ncbi:hypothetical protein MX635_13805 [Carnobacterium divergens]|uniref:Uncharacterized protein n=1 Tax=Carnobacterium divergens TaxID=2748 RepID=A0AAW8RH25_CARDV|nr:hypothetical protein [Carnobacterium divergens]MDT1975478.1 hypothetical protein [Carnobacterium divergens]
MTAKNYVIQVGNMYFKGWGEDPLEPVFLKTRGFLIDDSRTKFSLDNIVQINPVEVIEGC